VHFQKAVRDVWGSDDIGKLITPRQSDPGSSPTAIKIQTPEFLMRQP